MIPTPTGSEGWHLKRLLGRLASRRPRYDRADSYLDGTAAVPTMTDRAVREAYRRLMAMSGTNYGELAVEAVRERMHPIGFRTGASADGAPDDLAWRAWEANDLAAESATVHRYSLGLGDGYTIVGPADPDLGEFPVVTAEDPRYVITEHDPRRRRRVTMAATLKADTEAGTERAWLYVWGGLVMEAARPFKADAAVWSDDWEWVAAYRLPFPDVPVVRFPNLQIAGPRRDGLGDSWGEIERHTGVLDRINYQILTRLEVATMQAFKQRAIKGVPLKDSTGKEIDYAEIFPPDPGAMWHLPAAAEIWESGQVDMSGIRLAVRDDVTDFAAVTRTPLYYLSPDASNGSAEGASLAREGLVFKTGDRVTTATPGWKQTQRLIWLYMGDEVRADAAALDVLWESPDRHTLASRFDAAVKAKDAGVPWHERMELIGMKPDQISRMRSRFPENAANPDDVDPGAVDPA